MKTLKSMRLHIGFFGRTNVGKSSVLNKITEQSVSIVSKIAGTTTDVVEKSMELIPIGPVTFLDTAGLDDISELGVQRVKKALKVINRIDIAVIITDSKILTKYEDDLIEKLNELKIPHLIIVNKQDDNYNEIYSDYIMTSAVNDDDIVDKFKDRLIDLLPEDYVNSPKILSDLVPEKSVVILVIPIDKEAPKGRIILPQVQALRDLLDFNHISVCVQTEDLHDAIVSLKRTPALVVTDSQAFKEVSEIVPEDIPLTSFSILFARLKGDLNEFVKGVKAIENLKENSKVLFLESCTHNVLEDDIAREKIPKLLKKKTGLDLIFEYYCGHDIPDLEKYDLIIHCGACMTNRREILSRIMIANKKKIPITNYGVTISYCLGILPRAIKIFS